MEQQKNPWKKWLSRALVIPALLLFWLAFRHVSWEELQSEIQTVDPFWVMMILLPSWGGQFLRSWRWQLLLGEKQPGFSRIYHALLSGYFVNLGIPRAGEILRCVLVRKNQEPSFALVLGTVVTERLIDLLMLGLVVISAFALQWEFLHTFFTSQIFDPLLVLLARHRHLIFIFGLAALLLMAFLWYSRRRWMSFLSRKTYGFSAQLTDGIWQITRLNRRQLLLFILLSIGIWFTYFCTTWFWFLALPSARGAGLAVAFSVMVMGSLAKTLPIHGGGLGAYHFLVGQLLVLYGLGSVSSQTFALLNHGYQTIFYLLFGGFSFTWISWKRLN